MKDELGERMKSQYEDRTRYSIPRRTFAIIRLDGKAFHTYTKGLEKPFDHDLSEDLDGAIRSLLPHIQGAVFAYTQSDEISVLVTDFALPTTAAWFDGNVQKMSSVSASIMTAEFNRLRARRWRKDLNANLFMEAHGQGEEAAEHSYQATEKGCQFKIAYFDSRVFTIPDRTEVMNYFIWRNQDASRNSVSMVAQSFFSHKELQNVSTTGMKEKLWAIGKPWESFLPSDRFGRLIVKKEFEELVEFGGPRELRLQTVTRTRWVSKDAWPFTGQDDDLLSLIPSYDH